MSYRHILQATSQFPQSWHLKAMSTTLSLTSLRPSIRLSAVIRRPPAEYEWKWLASTLGQPLEKRWLFTRSKGIHLQ